MLRVSARTYLIDLYLDYINNYLTIEKFAEHNGLHNKEAKNLLNLAAIIYEAKHPEE